MKPWMLVASCCLVTGAMPHFAGAQERIYRCGNEYTNSATVAKQRNCQVVEGGHVTVVHSGGSKPAAPDNKSASSSASRNAAQVDAGQQKHEIGRAHV